MREMSIRPWRLGSISQQGRMPPMRDGLSGFNGRNESVAVNKMTLAGVSLVAAIPGLVVAGLMVSAFLNYAGQASNMLLFVVGLTLLCSAALALMPVGIYVFHDRQRGAAKAAGKKGATSGAIPVTAMTAEFDATGEVDEESSEFEVTGGEFDAVEFDDSEFIEVDDDDDEHF